MIGEQALYEFVLAGSFAVFALMVFVYVRSGRGSMFHPVTVYLAFHFITFVLRPVLAYVGQFDLIYRAYQFTPTMGEKSIALLAANLGLVVFVIAALVFGNEKPVLRGSSEAELGAYLKPVVIACLVAGFPAAWSLYFMLSELGSESTMILDAATGVGINTTNNGYFVEAQLMLAVIGGMFAYIFAFRWWSILPFAAFVLLRMSTGGRGPAIAATFVFVLLYLFRKRKRWLTATTLGLTAGAFFVFRLIGDDRGGALRAFLGIAGEGVDNGKLRLLESMDWGNMEFFEYIVHAVPTRSGTYDYFLSYLQIFTEPVPRVLWEGKPIGAPIRLFNLFDYGFPIGMTHSLPGDGWLELGWIGVVIVSILFGWIYGRAYNWFMRSSQSPVHLAIYCAFLATAIISFRDGQPITILREAIFYLAPPLLAALLAKAFGVVDTPIAFSRPSPARAEKRPALRLSPRERRGIL